MSADPLRLRALAHRLDTEADQVRALARRVDDVAAVGWRSAAAERFRERVEETAISLRHTAARLDEAAALTRAHAEAVERAVAVLTQVARDAAEAAAETGTAVPRAIGGGAHELARWVVERAGESRVGR